MNIKRYLSLAILLILSLLLLLGCELTNTPPASPTVHLLLVALDYGNAGETNKDAPVKLDFLSGTLIDAVEFGAALNSRGAVMDISVETTIMFQKGKGIGVSPYYPTKENILEQIKVIKNHMEPQDLFVFYYSGHGENFSGNLATAKPAAIGPNYELLTPAELYAAVSKLPGTKLVLLDSCYSGQHITTYPEKFISWFTPLDSYDGSLFFLTAANQNQESWEKTFGEDELTKHSHGYFSFFFLEALGWEHYTTSTNTFSPTYGDAGSYDYRGQMRSDNYVPAQKGSTISLSSIMEYVKVQVKNISGLFSKQNVSTTMGPRDLILFDSRW